MSARRALLIGAEDYGEGFARLPAVQQDIRLLRSALEASGYKVELCPRDVIANAGMLDDTMRTFCSTGGPEDVYIVYFTGHGLLVDNVDWIVPAETSRKGRRLVRIGASPPISAGPLPSRAPDSSCLLSMHAATRKMFR